MFKLTFLHEIFLYPQCKGIPFVGVSYTEKKFRPANLADLQREPVWTGTCLEGFYCTFNQKDIRINSKKIHTSHSWPVSSRVKGKLGATP